MKEYAQRPESKRRMKINIEKYRRKPGVVEHLAACRKIYAKEYLQRPEVKQKIKERERTLEQKCRRIFWCARKRARRKGLPFNLTLEDIVIPKRCPVLGLKIEIGIGVLHARSPVLDRKNNKRGYVRGNVGVISAKANMLKCDMSIAQVRAMVKYMEGRA